jgi:hypothetical protein
MSATISMTSVAEMMIEAVRAIISDYEPMRAGFNPFHTEEPVLKRPP